MKTQITSLIKGNHKEGIIGTNNRLRTEIAQKVISENPDKLIIKFDNQIFELTANWSKSGKSVSYSGIIPVESYIKKFGMTGIPKKITPKVIIVIDNDMTIRFLTNSRKITGFQYGKESDIEIL